MSQEYLDKLKIVPQECSCERCKKMCHAPCCGSVEDFEKLIDAGFADRLMFDNLPSYPNDGGDMLKPALKGYGGQQAPWATSSIAGCTFWDKNGLCQLHNLGLKPTQGKIALHENPHDYIDQYSEISKEDWESERGLALIERWKKLVNYQEDSDSEDSEQL